jgi:hypothetical protein
MKLVPNNDLNSEYSYNLKLDQKLPLTTNLDYCHFQIVLLDVFNQTAIGEYQFKSINKMYNDNFNISFSIYNTFPCFSAIYPIESALLTNLTDRPIELVLNSSFFSNEIALSLGINRTLLIDLNVRKCTKGEYFDQKNLECLPCEPNFFSFEDGFVEPVLCKSCISEPFYCYGGFNHTPKLGYWRSGYKSIKFIKCPNSLGNQL